MMRKAEDFCSETTEPDGCDDQQNDQYDINDLQMEKGITRWEEDKWDWQDKQVRNEGKNEGW